MSLFSSPGASGKKKEGPRSKGPLSYASGAQSGVVVSDEALDNWTRKKNTAAVTAAIVAVAREKAEEEDCSSGSTSPPPQSDSASQSDSQSDSQSQGVYEGTVRVDTSLAVQQRQQSRGREQEAESDCSSSSGDDLDLDDETSQAKMTEQEVFTHTRCSLFLDSLFFLTCANADMCHSLNFVTRSF